MTDIKDKGVRVEYTRALFLFFRYDGIWSGGPVLPAGSDSR